MDDIKTFEQVYVDMRNAYSDYLASCEPFQAEENGDYKVTEQDREARDNASDILWQLAHQVLSNALFVLNEETGEFNEDEFIFEFPAKFRENTTGYIAGLLKTGIGNIQKVGTQPIEGVVWFENADGKEYYDDDRALNVWEVYCVAVALYKMTEPLGSLIET